MQLWTVQSRWLLYLMIFFIGWSRVFAASIDLPPAHHALPQIATTMTKQHEMQVKPQQDMDCHQAMAGQKHLAESASPQACPQADPEHGMHMSCVDCSSAHCQNLSSALPQPAITADLHGQAQSTATVYADDPARHLSGYWQEILRPPRTSSVL